MLQSGFFDLRDRFSKLDELGDPLKALSQVIDWSVFEPMLAKGLAKEKKSNAGRPRLPCGADVQDPHPAKPL